MAQSAVRSDQKRNKGRGTATALIRDMRSLPAGLAGLYSAHANRAAVIRQQLKRDHLITKKPRPRARQSNREEEPKVTS